MTVWQFTHTCEIPHDSIISLRGIFVTIKVVYPRHFLMKCLDQTRKVSDHVYVLAVSILPLSTTFLLDLELCRQCGIFVGL